MTQAVPGAPSRRENEDGRRGSGESVEIIGGLLHGFRCQQHDFSREHMGEPLAREWEALDRTLPASLDKEFDEHNGDLKLLMTRWQLKAAHGGCGAPTKQNIGALAARRTGRQRSDVSVTEPLERGIGSTVGNDRCRINAKHVGSQIDYTETDYGACPSVVSRRHRDQFAASTTQTP
jgi:hypothetical protein